MSAPASPSTPAPHKAGTHLGANKAVEALHRRVEHLEAQAQQTASAISHLQTENQDLRRSVLLWDLARYKAHSKPLSVLCARAASTCWPQEPSLLTVMRLEGFEKLISPCVTPATRNRRFAGKVAWNKLQKTCRELRSAPVSLELDPAVRIVPDNFPTIRRAVQNVDKQDKLDTGCILVRPRAEPYAEQVILDRRVVLMADPSSSETPVINGRICIDEGGGGSVLRGFAVRNMNPRDPWGSAIDIAGASDVLIEGCELSSSANDEAILNLHGSCVVTVRRNTIQGGEVHGVTGVSIDDGAKVVFAENTVSDSDVGILLQPSATVTIKGNVFSRNQKGVQLNDSGIEAIVEQGGFGTIRLSHNTYVENRDGHDDVSFLQSLEVLLHPLLRKRSRQSRSSSESHGVGSDEERGDPES